MKKVLFGIMALSMAAFAANPGTADTASVPVKVIAEIITAPTGLTITDEAGTVLDELVIDHKKIVKGKATDDSTAFELFKVQRFAEDGTNANLLLAAATATSKLEVSLDKADSVLKNLSDSTAYSLNSTLSLSGGSNPISSIAYDHKLNDGDQIHTGRVISTIPMGDLNKTELKAGIHHNGHNRPILSVTLVP